MFAETLPKKRKHSVVFDDSSAPSKKSKKEKKPKKEKKRKDKAKSKAPKSEFNVINASLVVSIPPVFASTPRTGVEEMLDSMVMRYIPAFRGVVLAHSNLRFLDQVATISGDCPFSVCKVGFDATVWSPHVGMKLVGKVNLCSPDHISILVHRTFNVSIPRYHIPTDEWEFEYGPAENDPEFGVEAADGENGRAEGSEEKQEENGGRWMHRVTGEKLGGPDGFLEFAVIGLTVANEMLSLLGSIQHDPFSPEHVPSNDQSADTPKQSSEEEVALTRAVEVLGVDDESDEDVFTHLNRMGGEAAANEARRKAEEEEAAKKEKKRKRKGAKEVMDLSSSNKPKRKKTVT